MLQTQERQLASGHPAMCFYQLAICICNVETPHAIEAGQFEDMKAHAAAAAEG